MTIQVGSKVILIPAYNDEEYECVEGYVPEVDETILAYPIEGGGYVAIGYGSYSIGETLLVPEILYRKPRPYLSDQWWGDSQFQDGEVKWFEDGAYFTKGTYRLEVEGWYTVWENYEDRYVCGSYDGKPKFISCCRASLYVVRQSQSGTTVSTSVSSICTSRNLSNLYGAGSFEVGDMMRIGIRISDSPYGDNHGDTTFTLKGPY